MDTEDFSSSEIWHRGCG